MEIAAKERLTAEEYLALERTAEFRSEFLDGEMFAMAGGTRRHSRIKVNLVAGLDRRLRSTPCQVFDSDMRIKVEATGLYAYPDAHVACDGLRFEDEDEDTLLNPKLLQTIEGPEAKLPLESIHCVLPLAEIYANTGLP